MARLLARTLTLGRPAAPGSSLQPHRALSDKVELIEIDLSEESASSTSSGDSAEEPMVINHGPFCALKHVLGILFILQVKSILINHDRLCISLALG
ncbi:hypothetical protein TRIUR3_34203 [Triticum urartu]|uniref:Uncharacterized protein n=2 Tax=Triticum TaxID=4564 RepID=A0A9R1P304_TRITD|nr:hypothetical protein TRIUR3_34203 [Triticum urartu]VAH35959.1 unnamed protein product [Triticum turgidum subsp. durum]